MSFRAAPERACEAAGRGRFITLEGGEGAGKSTQIESLRRRLEARHLEVVTTREPGGSPRAEAIRDLVLRGGARRHGAFAETLLFAAARADHVSRTIRPALERGAFVVSDRFVDSTRVYQGALGRVALPVIATLERVATAGVMPDLTLILDLPAEVGITRAAARRERLGLSADRFEGEGAAYHARIRGAFVEIAAAEPERCAVVPAEGSAEDVSARVWDVLAARLLDPRTAGRTGSRHVG